MLHRIWKYVEEVKHLSLGGSLSVFEELPIRTPEDLNKFAHRILDEFSKAVKLLGLLGGRTIGEGVRQVLSKILHNDLALKMTWSGTEKKISMRDFPDVIQLVAVSMCRNKMFENSTQLEIDEHIKKWLRNSIDHHGGRRKRMKI